MKIVCDECGEIGEPAEVWRSGERVRLECRHCGHMNDASGTGASAARAASGVGAALSEVADDGAEEVSGSAAESMRSPSPEPAPKGDGQGPRWPWLASALRSPDVGAHQCAKCGARQPESESCARCGFVFANHRPGEMPWDRGESVNRDLIDEAEPLWERALLENTTEAHEAFLTHCLEHDLDEFAGRRYRFHVADWPEDTVATEMLARMMELAQARLGATLGAERDRLRQDVNAVRKRLLVVVFIAGLALAVALYSLYPRLS